MKEQEEKNRYDLDYHRHVKVLLMESGHQKSHWNPVQGLELKIAKYGKCCIFTGKIVIKCEKNMDGGNDVGVLFTWSVHTS